VGSMSIAVLQNALPAWGVFALGWHPGTLLMLFWFDNVVGTLAQSLTIRRHQQLTADPAHVDPARYANLGAIVMRGHYRRFWLDYLGQAFGAAMLLGMFALGLPFVLALKHPERLPALRPETSALLLAVAALLALHALDFRRMRTAVAGWSFAALHRAARARYAQVVLLSLVVLAGSFAVLGSEDPRALAAVLLGFKLVFDVAFAWRRRA
jgi:hypothetical protein